MDDIKQRRFKMLAEQMLHTHYGLELNDTQLCEDGVIDQCIKQGFSPFDVIAEHAREADLERVDIQGLYGAPSKEPVTQKDQDAADRECLRKYFVQLLPPDADSGKFEVDSFDAELFPMLIEPFDTIVVHDGTIEIVQENGWAHKC